MKNLKGEKYFLSKNKIGVINKLFIIAIIFIFIISLLWYFKLNLYFTDKYDWYVYLGNKHLEGGMNNKALDYANKAVGYDEDRSEAYKLKIKIYLKGLYKDDEELSPLKDENRPYFYYIYAGFILREQGMLNEALYYFKKSIEVDPFFIDGHIGLGLTYLKMDDIENAFKYLNQSKKFLGQSYISGSSEYQDALLLIHMGLGIIYKKKGFQQKAEEEFKIVESIRPNIVNRFLI